jgi:hypothetical protein
MPSKKDTARRTLFNLWIPTKVVVSGKPDTSPTDSGTSESPATEPIIPGVGRDRLRARLTRSGSKILLFLGLRGSSKSEYSISFLSAEQLRTYDLSQATKMPTPTPTAVIPHRAATKAQVPQPHRLQAGMMTIARDI